MAISAPKPRQKRTYKKDEVVNEVESDIIETEDVVDDIDADSVQEDFVVDKVYNNESYVGNSDKDEKIAFLEKQIEEMKKIMESFVSNNTNVAKDTSVETVVNTSSKSVEKPSYDDLIKVVSLCYGILNLSVDGNVKVRFERFGETHSVRYATLVDIVSQNRKAVDKGRFYILSKNAIHDLDLVEKFEKILPAEIIDKITDYSDMEIKDMLDTMPDGQKQSTIQLLIDKIVSGKKMDLNKIDFISKTVGVDIKSKAEEADIFKK